ncbi:MAG: DUF4123 domain-containing protein [Paracoccus sp. (in: a-proteobacteria)]|nr:DUF4123 domain-containing protein [Paracoccus sp. (in: a-proteobacteria)]
MSGAGGIYLGWIDGSVHGARVIFAGHADTPEALARALPAPPTRVYPLADWIETGFADDFCPDLPLRIGPGSPPMLMTAGPKGFLPYQPATDGGAILVQDLGVIAPLGDAIGAERLDCPPALAPVFFDGPDRRLYAVIDAALIPELLPRLEAEGLRAESLFQGKANENLSDVAPWLVELPPGTDCLRRLMTASDRAGRGWYGADAALFLHSGAGFDGLRRHLRKFTKLADEDGQWMFLRFWSEQFRDYLTHQPDPPLPGAFFDRIEALFIRLPGDRWQRLAARRAIAGDRARFLPAFRAHARFLLRRRFTARLADELAATMIAPPSPARLSALYAQARAQGFASERAILFYVETLLLARRLGLSEAAVLAHPEARDSQFYSDVGRARALRSLLKSLEAA